MACATALQLQRQYPDLRLLLFSTDPAHSLSDCLKLKLQALPTQVIRHLDAQEVNAEAEFDSVRRNFRQELAEFLQQALPQIDITFDREVMEHLLDLAPPGLDEIIALTLIIEHIDQGRYDMIIVDAAPSGHLLRLLEMPELIRDWLRLFFALLLKYRQVMRLPNLSARLVALSRGLKKLHSLLQNPQQTRLYAVTIATELAVEKTVEMLESLQKLGIDQPTNSGEPMPILPSSGSERDISAKSRAGLVCRIAANQGFSANRTRGYRDADGFR
jgi:arsenite-transporting ATPase